MGQVELTEITPENWEAVCCLSPGREGAEFVASNSFSIAQSVYEEGWIIKGIAVDGLLIGFTMYGYSEALAAYELCRLMIDSRHQGKGYGKQALDVIIDEMRRRFGCGEIYLSTAPGNSRGKHVYEQAGFLPTGKTCGEDDDIEEIYCLKSFD